MNIGILQCDRVSDQFSTEHGQYPEMFIRLLKPIDQNLRFTIFNAEQGELPNTPHATDAYLITGSRHGVNDGLIWIKALEGFVRQLQAQGKKLIGICFGHQLIAKALGGRVARSPQGWGIGVSSNKLTRQKSWMTPACDELHLLASHQDQVVELPHGAELLAASDFCPFYMLQIEDNFLTVQGHPEFSKSYSQALIENRKTIYGEELAARGLLSLQLDVDDKLFAQWIVNFLRGS